MYLLTFVTDSVDDELFCPNDLYRFIEKKDGGNICTICYDFNHLTATCVRNFITDSIIIVLISGGGGVDIILKCFFKRKFNAVFEYLPQNSIIFHFCVKFFRSSFFIKF